VEKVQRSGARGEHASFMIRLSAAPVLAAACALLVLASCAHRPVKPKPLISPGGELMAPASWTSLGTIKDDMDFTGLADAVRGSLGYYDKLPAGKTFQFGTRTVTAAELSATLKAFLTIVANPALSATQKISDIKDGFVLYRSVGSDGAGSVLFTGYYEPELQGRRHPDATFKYPLYARPADLMSIDLSEFPLAHSKATVFGRVDGDRVVPYYTRKQIDTDRALQGKGLELLWLDDPVDLFFLQIQGSGLVLLPDGQKVRVQYAGKNGQPYVSLGRYMVKEGLLGKGQVSLQSIRAYIAHHPKQMRKLLDVNPSYTFFRLENSGPYGNIDVAITPGRSIATDARIFPRGALCLIRTEKPLLDSKNRVVGWEPFTRFVMNQDTGGAITGPGRVDLFCGAGPEAEATAGHMQQKGSLYFILEKK